MRERAGARESNKANDRLFRPLILSTSLRKWDALFVVR
jgi:hypothetical protein